MPRVGVLVPISPTDGFFSEVAALSRALERLPWTSWEPSLHVYLGGPIDQDAFDRWSPHLRSAEMHLASQAEFERLDDWAQSDAVFRVAPADVDVLLTLDADTLPVAGFEDVLDQVHADGCIAGTIAHFRFPHERGTTSLANWTALADGLVPGRVPFDHDLTLLDPAAPAADRQTPYYLNMGVVFFPRATFARFADAYLELRPQVVARMGDADFSGQVALTLAVLREQLPRTVLPMRFNYPNDPRVPPLHPGELEDVRIFHYLRTQQFDRQGIFTSAEAYHRFLALDLTGPDARFRAAVRDVLGAAYPFG